MQKNGRIFWKHPDDPDDSQLQRGPVHYGRTTNWQELNVFQAVDPAISKTQRADYFTMGAGGSDVALETAAVALMSDDLSGLPFAVGLSRACRRIIRQNLWASLGMVAFLIPATILGFAGIGLAVALHEGSTLLVVGNALRLLAFRDERSAS